MADHTILASSKCLENSEHGFGLGWAIEAPTQVQQYFVIRGVTDVLCCETLGKLAIAHTALRYGVADGTSAT